MSGISSANRLSLFVAEEAAYGDPPNGVAVTQLEPTSATIAPQKTSEVSEAITADRLRSDDVLTGFSTSGDIGFQVSARGWDSLWKSLLYSPFTDVENTGKAITTVQDDPNLVSADAAFSGIVAGQAIRITGFADSTLDGTYRVLTKSDDNNVSVAPAPSAAEAGTGLTIRGGTARLGTTRTSLLFVRDFSDVLVWDYANGCYIGSVSLSHAARARMTGTWSIQGKETIVSASKLHGAETLATAPELLTGSATSARLIIDGALTSLPIQSLDLQISNNLREVPTIGSGFAACVNDGFFDVSGTLNTYLQDVSLYSKVISHGESSIGFSVEATNGDSFSFYIPRVRLSGSPEVPGGNQEVTMNLSFNALKDPVLGTSFIVDRILVP